MTAEAAEQVLRAGGNAYDAALAALVAACVVEPVLASLAGGGFLLSAPRSGTPRLYDFFVQTPGRLPRPSDLDFHAIEADFGETRQEFHIGLGTAAVPGVVRGLFEIHDELGSIPMRDIVAPAVALAKNGIAITPFQAYLFRVVEATFAATASCRAIFGSREHSGELLREGERLVQPELADVLEVLAIEGADLFYRGELGLSLSRDMANGGLIQVSDLERYQVLRRAPLRVGYRGATVLTNPPPSSGGLLAAFGLALLAADGGLDCEFGSAAHVGRLADVMAATSEARLEVEVAGLHRAEASGMLDDDFVERYRLEIAGRGRAYRGTTHISVIDADQNLASLTVSNGEGCGYVIPGSGIVLNNMLGEEDLNPSGFHRWTPDERMTSMMAPTALAWPDGRRIVTGSGGSNRIRSVILQMVANIVDFGLDIDAAVDAPRIHWERDRLDVEGGFDPERIAPALTDHPEHRLWSGRNLFFGGAHTVESHRGDLRGSGDPRRAGVVRTC